MRVGLGLSFMVHGWPKMIGGPDKWAKYGESLAVATGISFWPQFWGFMAAVAELGGGALLVLGLMMRPATFLLFCTMVVAALYHFNSGDGFGGYSHAMEAAFTFFGLFFVGPGKYSLDKRLR
jgi:putative oxidoreductase